MKLLAALVVVLIVAGCGTIPNWQPVPDWIDLNAGDWE